MTNHQPPENQPNPEPHQPHEAWQGGAPEYLESGGGRRPARSGRRRRPLLLAGLGVLGLGVAGGVAFGAWWYLADGGSAAEALPADSLGYVGLTLDPSGQQKLQALETLRKFPALAEELDLEGDASDVDLKERLVDLVLEDAPCTGLSHGEDVEPWLGDRLGVAAVDLGDDAPAAVVAVEVTDAEAADEGLAEIDACGDDSGEASFAWSVEGDWLLATEDAEGLARVQDLVAEGTLADDEDFQRWTSAAGGEGLVTLYAAPAAGPYLAGLVERDPALAEDLGVGVPGQDELPEQVEEALGDFAGAGARLRFTDGALELEGAGSIGESGYLRALSGDVSELVGSLPADTGLAYAMGVQEGWFDELLTYLADTSQGLVEADELADELVRLTGLTGSDLEAAVGGGVALAIGGGVDPAEMLGPDPTSFPLALKVDGEVDDVEKVVEALSDQLGPDAGLVGLAEGDAGVTVGLDGPWLDEVADGGELGRSERFRTVLPDADRAEGISYLDLDAVRAVVAEALEQLGGPDEATQVLDDLAPLAAFGAASWLEDDVLRLRVRLTTD